MFKKLKEMQKEQRHIKVILIIAVASVFLIAGSVNSVMGEKTHLDRMKVKGGCKSCHNPHSKKEKVLKGRVEDVCLECHGTSSQLDMRAKSNIFSLIIKRSNHPIIETSKYHKKNEELPETDPAMPRHVSCLDCHNVHMTQPGKSFAWIKGVDISGIKRRTAKKESEICYNCHSESINLPATSSNIRLQFDPSSASYHPVERAAKGRSVSLYRNISQGSLITCTNCHEPHGSDYAPLLKANYTMTDGAESSYAYELCYNCHNRDSILSNQSFKGSTTAVRDYGHKEHIVFQNTSCHTCHASHGNTLNPKLISFNPAIVTGSGMYVDYQGGRAQCNLTCHSKAHQ